MLHLNRKRRAELAISMEQLTAALRQGWVIDPPVYRKRLPGDPADRWYYDFIVWREGKVQVLTVPEGEEVQQFLREQGLAVTNG